MIAFIVGLLLLNQNIEKMVFLLKWWIFYEEYARNNEYINLTIKTGNNKREMLSYLVKNNWNFVEVIPGEKLEDNEIILKKEL